MSWQVFKVYASRLNASKVKGTMWEVWRSGTKGAGSLNPKSLNQNSQPEIERNQSSNHQTPKSWLLGGLREETHIHLDRLHAASPRTPYLEPSNPVPSSGSLLP